MQLYIFSNYTTNKACGNTIGTMLEINPMFERLSLLAAKAIIL